MGSPTPEQCWRSDIIVDVVARVLGVYESMAANKTALQSDVGYLVSSESFLSLFQITNLLNDPAARDACCRAGCEALHDRLMSWRELAINGDPDFYHTAMRISLAFLHSEAHEIKALADALRLVELRKNGGIAQTLLPRDKYDVAEMRSALSQKRSVLRNWGVSALFLRGNDHGITGRPRIIAEVDRSFITWPEYWALADMICRAVNGNLPVATASPTSRHSFDIDIDLYDDQEYMRKHASP